MTALTMPGDATPDAVARYQSALLSLLGDADPLAVLRAAPERYRAALEATVPERRHTPEALGKWSIAHVLHHLADSELVFSNRLRRVLAEDRPRLAGYDQDLWADRLNYAAHPPALSVELFATVRAANLRVLDAAAAEDFERVGMHGERGEESIMHMTRLYAGHDLAHLAQIERIQRSLA